MTTPAVATGTPLGILQRPTAPLAHGRQMRAALPPAVRRKLEHLETIAAEAHAVVRLASDRATVAHEELRRITDRIAELRSTHADWHPGRWIPDRSKGPTAMIWQATPGESIGDLETALATATVDSERLAAVRDAAQARWQRLARLAERSATYLGVPAR